MKPKGKFSTLSKSLQTVRIVKGERVYNCGDRELLQSHVTSVYV